MGDDEHALGETKEFRRMRAEKPLIVDRKIAL